MSPSNETISWRNSMQSESSITRWHVQEEVRAVKVALSEYDYLDPGTAVEGEKEFDEAISEPLGEMEWFEHPALVVQNSSKATSTNADSAASK